jgi:hypothetical protein
VPLKKGSSQETISANSTFEVAMAIDARIAPLRQMLTSLRYESDQWYNEWQEIGWFMCPRKSNALMGGSTGAPLGWLGGRKQTMRVLNQAGERSADLLAASLHGNLTNPALKWQSLNMRQRELNDKPKVREWLDDTSQTLADALNRSNFTNEMGEWYSDLGVFGTAAMMMEVLPPQRPGLFGGYLFNCMNVGSYWMSEASDGRVNTLFRQIVMPVAAAYEKWGDKIGKKWLEKKKDKPYEMATFLHAVYPRENWEPGNPRSNRMRFASVVWDEEQEIVVNESGFHDFPYIAGRWSKATGEVYGRGPGHKALGELKTLCKTRELKLLGLGLDVAPPTFEKESAIVGDLKWEPLGRNVVRDDAGKDAVWTLNSGTRYDISQIEEQEMVTTIEKCFFVDQIRALPPTDKPSYMTAYEVAKRYEETFRLLGPPFGRMTSQGEGIGHVVDRGVQALGRAGMLQPLPPELTERRDAEMDVEYLGPLALAQKSSDVNAIDLEFAWLQQQEQLDPGMIRRNYKMDELVQYRARARGIPAKLLTNEEERAAIVQQEAEQKQKEEALMRSAATAKGMGDAAPMIRALKPQEQAA